MADILKCCQDLENRLNNKRSLEQVFNDCARKRLIDLYNQENDEFDRLLNKLYDNEPITRQMINYYTKPLGKYVKQIFGW
jgi:hypothetical protein